MARAPAFLAAVAFAAGVWLGTAAWRPPLWWLVAAIACIVGATFARKSQRFAYALALLEREVLDANEIQLLIQGKPLPARQLPTPSGDDHGNVQQVLKPEPGRQPGIAPGERPSPA